ncbi:hypothetical protein CRUP_023055 [Coryphaenoides rupestris]|nr:hypothetical protein CRUP_023055 [Coryphaenoides rupestris]
MYSQSLTSLPAQNPPPLRSVVLDPSSCSESCLQKYLKMTQRISLRFQEYHIQQNEALAAKAGLLAQPR